MATHQPHDGEDIPRVERCCTAPDITATWGLGTGENNIITVHCQSCFEDLLVIWPKGSLAADGWPNDWTRPHA